MKEAVKDFILLVAMIVFAFALIHSCDPKVAKSKEKDDVALWLARSCTGEAGWKAHESGECLAVWHIYKKRSELSNRSILWIAKRYSAAIKPRKGRHNRWVLHLNREGLKPKHWPQEAKWEPFKEDWFFTLFIADQFVAGDFDSVDPVPEAMHYGSKVDRPRAIRAGWKLVKTDFRNQFWRVPNGKKKKEN